MTQIILVIFALAPLPPATLAAIADPTVREVTLPPGRFAVTPQSAIRVTRSDLRIKGYGTTLVPEGVVDPVIVKSHFREVGNWRETHLTGAVEAGTDTLTLADKSDLAPGEVVLVRLGVSDHDPNEPEFQVWQTVESVTDGKVKFTLPFGRKPYQWANYDTVVAVTGEWQRYKVGPWENVNGLQKRGLGTDHGLWRFVGGKPVENVTIEGVTVEWTQPARYAESSFQAAFAQRVRFKDLRIVNPRGSGLHLFSCLDSGVERFTLTGSGDNAVYYLSGLHYTATAMTLWGGIDCYGRGIRIDGRNQTLLNCEVGSVGTVVEDCSVRTAYDPGVRGVTQLGVHGQHPGFTIRNLRLDMPVVHDSFVGGHTESGLTLENIAFEGTRFTDFMQWKNFHWSGTVRVGHRVFGPMRRITLEHTVSWANPNSQQIPVPSGLYARGQVTVLANPEGLRQITCPSVVFPRSDGALVCPLTSGRFGQSSPGEVQAYLDGVSKDVWCWLKPGAQPVRVRFEGDCFAE